MLNWIRSLFQKYKIVHDPELGYYAAYHDGIGWWCIEKSGETGVDPSNVCYFKHYFDSTIEQAGKRVNKHALNRGRKIVWRG